MDKIGIFGGTFNPPHVVHVQMAAEAMEELHFDKLLIIPNRLPPHKEVAQSVSEEHRLEMAKLAFGDIPRVEINEMEVERDGKSYTYDTVCQLERRYPDAELYLIMGEDMLDTLECWYEAAALLKKVRVLAFNRGGYSTDMGGMIAHLQEKFGAKITVAHMAPVKKSSTEIRTYGARGDVPPSVEAYMLAHGLYEEI